MVIFLILREVLAQTIAIFDGKVTNHGKKIPQENPPLYLSGIKVKRVGDHKHLGFIFHPKLNCTTYFKERSAKTAKGSGMLKQLREYLPTNVYDYNLYDALI